MKRHERCIEVFLLRRKCSIKLFIWWEQLIISRLQLSTAIFYYDCLLYRQIFGLVRHHMINLIINNLFLRLLKRVHPIPLLIRWIPYWFLKHTGQRLWDSSCSCVGLLTWTPGNVGVSSELTLQVGLIKLLRKVFFLRREGWLINVLLDIVIEVSISRGVGSRFLEISHCIR